MELVLIILASGLFLVMHLLLASRVGGLERELRDLRHAFTHRPSVRAEQQAEPPPPSAPEGQTLGNLFEQLVGGRMLIWIGGIALVVAGFFLIRYSIEVGLVTEAMRMVAAALFGVALLAMGEYARGGRLFAEDQRIAQALVGAGIAVLYATAYGSWYLFALIGPTAASALMLLITVGALVLSQRHGAPTAVMGLVGGFLTPWLVGDPRGGAGPILAYLALLNVAIFTLAWRRRWTWLAAGAVALSFLWTGFLIFGPRPDALAAGGFVLVLAVAASTLRPGEGRELLLMQPLIIGLVQLAALVARVDTGLAAWLLFGALSAAALALSVARAEFRYAPPAALLLTLFLLAAKATTEQDPLLAPAAAAATLLFGAVSIALARRERLMRTLVACGGLAGPLAVVRGLRPELADQALWGALAAALALAALFLLRLHRPDQRLLRMPDIAMVAAGGTAALLLGLAAYDLAPRDYVSAVWLVLSLGLLVAGVRIPDKALRLAGLILLTATVLRVFLIDAAALQGILRILSFVGLGLALIGVGTLYGTVLRAERKKGDGAGAGEPSGGSNG